MSLCRPHDPTGISGSAVRNVIQISSRVMRLNGADTLCEPAAGLAIALDVLVFGGRLKLEVTGLLGTIARLENIAGSDSYGILSWILGGTTLFESFFFPKRAAMMNGPLINASRGGCPS